MFRISISNQVTGLAIAAVLAAPTVALAAKGDDHARAKAFDVCVNAAANFRLDDADGSGGLSAGDGITAVGIVLPGGTIPTDGIGAPQLPDGLGGLLPACSQLQSKKIGTFFVSGRVVLGLPDAAPDDLAYVDWQFRIDGRGVIDTTGPVKITGAPLGTYAQTVTGGTGKFKSLKGEARVLVLDGTGGFQIRLLLPSGDH